MVENMLNKSISLVKEISIDKGVFSLRSKSNKFSASESYKENFEDNKLPDDAPELFEEAIPNLFYSPLNKDLISYKEFHEKIDNEKDLILSSIDNPGKDDIRNANKEASLKILKEFGINNKTLMIYSPMLKEKLDEGDEKYFVSATYNPNEKVILVKTERIQNEEEQEDFVNENIQEDFEEIEASIIEEEPINSISEESNTIEEEAIIQEEANNNSTNLENENNEPIQEIEEPKVEISEPVKLTDENKDEKPKVDLEEIKKKYKFKKPEGGRSISDILKGKKGSSKKDSETYQTEVKINDPEQQLKDIITDSLHSINGKWNENVFQANFKESGYLVPVERVEIQKENILIISSPVTNIEWWTKFTPVDKCPRYKGALIIHDEWEPFCKDAKCNEACNAEDGFVELSAARFRLVEESEIIKNDFKRLQDFLDRTYRLIEEFKSTFEVDLQLKITSSRPYIYAFVPKDIDESTLRSYFEAFLTIYPEITDVRGKIDIESFNLNDNFDPVTEDGLVQEARNYALQEMVRLGAKDMLHDIIQQKDGTEEGKHYVIDKGKMRYVLRPDRVEAIREELYMGNVTFKKGMKDIQNFFVTTLGGGRW